MPLSTPVVKIPRVGVRALYVEWEDINIPVDAWTVSVTEVPEEGSEPLPPVDVSLLCLHYRTFITKARLI